MYEKGKNSYPSLNGRQSSFVIEYLKIGNATESAIRAGYSKKTGHSIGQRLLKNVEINKAIEAHREKISLEADLTIAQVVREVRELAKNAESETNRLRAYDMLMKHLGGYVNELKVIERLSDDQINELYSKVVLKIDESCN